MNDLSENKAREFMLMDDTFESIEEHGKPFEVRKREFLNEIKNDDMFYKVLKQEVAKKGSKEDARILLNPSDDKELRISKAFFQFSTDYFKFLTALAYGDIRPIPIEENKGVSFYISIIKLLKLKKNDEVKEILNNLTPEVTARIFYEYAVAKCLNEQEAKDFIAEKAEFKANKLGNVLMKLYISKVVIPSPNNKTFANSTDNDVIYLEKFANSFRESFKDGKQSNKAERARMAALCQSIAKGIGK